MLDTVDALGCHFRAHVKTHKTTQGARIQLDPRNTGRLNGSIVVSTLTEAWSMKPLIDDGSISDILYGLPPARSRIPELRRLHEIVQVTLLIDHPSQLTDLDSSWRAFVKIDCGTHRAGLRADSDELKALVRRIKKSEVTLVGFYCHSGHSYAAKTIEAARAELINELDCAQRAKSYAETLGFQGLLISVGATPTAHAAIALSKAEVQVYGDVEIHAGCYPCNDLQQLCTSLITPSQIAIKILTEVISCYDERNEILINAGTIALAKETSAIAGYGTTEIDGETWTVVRMSQEHGILSGGKVRDLYGRRVLITPQHACITSASYATYFIIENDKVVDIWHRANGWT